MSVHPSIIKIGKLTNELSEKKSAWLRNILFLASSLFGILVSLQTNNAAPIQVRLCFALSLILLAIGILSTALSLYSEVEYRNRGRKSFVKEAINALHEDDREPDPVSVPVIRFFAICEIVAYTSFLLAIISLASYSVLLQLG